LYNQTLVNNLLLYEKGLESVRDFLNKNLFACESVSKCKMFACESVSKCKMFAC